MRPLGKRRKNNYLLFSPPVGILRTFMEDTNYNFWGLIVVPVGLLICFGLALLVWLRAELTAEPEDKEN
jgi:hypothetical protein